MVENREFNGDEWAKKKGLPDTWKIAMDLIERNLKDKIVLDAGCGHDLKANYFSKVAAEIHSIDLIEGDVKEAKDRYNAMNLFFEISDVEQLPFKDSTFHVIYSTWVIEHLKNPKKFIDEAYRVLKPGGILILWIPNAKSIEGVFAIIMPDSLAVQVLKILQHRDEVSYHKCYYRANSVRKLDKLSKDKFKRVHLERFDDIGYWGKFRFSAYLWFLKYKLSNNKLLNWTHSSFYVEYRKCL